MQTFYDTMGKERDPDSKWLERIRNASIEQIGVLQESVLAWQTWE